MKIRNKDKSYMKIEQASVIKNKNNMKIELKIIIIKMRMTFKKKEKLN